MSTPDGRVLDLFFITYCLGLLHQMSRILNRLLLKLRQGSRLRSLDSRMTLLALWPSFIHQSSRDRALSFSYPLRRS
ncbi:hypothetical protein D8674_022392 [Pyrus ussuriensis x Pyrus communis]|uniref:Uncharacterized protein n=1 Tax=Pyrus ussuriensis x Pyrus communis TaxID=2448454 RepID=A0A5N5GYG8_9ROSA|nr:hypothetical protein D8674_022392 [Pyrus ussuriensis x Pyrus communis]